MRSFARRSLQSALSIGPGYEQQPPGAFLDPHEVRGYFIDFRAKTVSPTAADPSRLLPAGLAQLALGWWERRLAGEPAAEAEFMRICALLESRAVSHDGELLWPYTVPVPKHGLRPPWHSALAQAQAASVFVRAYLNAADEHHAVLARRAIAPLLPSSTSGLLVQTEHGPVPEESPSRPPSLILNGWIYALWGLWDVAVALRDPDCKLLFEESTRCLRRTIGRYDAGWWSRYSLYPHRLPDLAKPFYHRLHVDQLELMNWLVGAPDLAEVAGRWAHCDTWPRRTAVIVQKAVFAAVR